MKDSIEDKRDELRELMELLDEVGRSERCARAEAERVSGEFEDWQKTAPSVASLVNGTPPGAEPRLVRGPLPALGESGVEEPEVAVLAGPGAESPESRAAGTESALGRRRLIAAAAAALVGVLSWRAFVPSEPRFDPDARLGGTSGNDEALSEGVGVEFGTFTWSDALPPGGRFEVAVYDPGAPIGTPPLATSGKLLESTWSADADEVRDWPDRIDWTLTIFDGMGKIDSVRSNPVERD